MLNISDGLAKVLKAFGALLLVAIIWVAYQYKNYIDSLPNYKILAFSSPLLICKSLLIIDKYRRPWDSLDARSKMYAVMFPLIPVATAIAALVWYIKDPSAGA